MILAERLRPRREATRAQGQGRVALPPVTLRGAVLHSVRTVWIIMAVAGVVIWLVEAPLFYHAALQLQNTNGMVQLQPAQWRLGLHRLGLAPSVYAVLALLTLSLMTWSMVLTGLVIFLRRSTEALALLVSGTFVTFGVGIMTAYAGGPALIRAHPEVALPLHVYLSLAAFSYYALFVLPLLFPDGRFVPRWSGWLAGAFTLLAIAGTLAPGSALDQQSWPAWLAAPLNVLWFGTVLLTPVYRYRRVSDPAQRQQTKWVLFGLVVSLGVFLAVGAVQSLVPGLTATPERAVLVALVGSTLAFGGLTLLPLSFAVAILRYHLWDIDLILNRTLVYGALTASVIGLYVLIVAVIGALVQTPGSGPSGGVLSLLATIVVALMAHPWRVRLQRGVNRLLYGDRDEPYAVIARLGRQLEGTLAPDAVLPAIVQTVAQALKLPYAAIAVQQDGTVKLAAAVGTPMGPPLRLPLVYQGETVGELHLGPRPGESAFSAADRHLLEDLARQAGVAASAVRLTAALQRSRERLVTAREEERRRLRRDLHDGLGPALASVALMADAARNLLARDPDAAAALLADLKAEAQAATAEIRRVVYELRPPALDELGLVPALQEQAAQYGPSGLHVTVVAPEPLPPLPAAVEVAAYRIATEALTNVLRHARARACTVRLDVADGLQLEIADDGCGLCGARAGVGRTAMRERAEELGGWCVVEPRPEGGTRVRAYLPWAARMPGGAA